ncbi:MAG TPA: MTH938/NDUFAF3 family protein [Rudaea sp.]|nr:MTH938/NDUFAF3 family protein [Rudaea sp.]
MQLTEHRNERQLFVRKADASTVVVVDRVFTRSLVLGAVQAIEDFAPRRVDELDAQAIARILTLQPEVVLLGTGMRAVFPPPAVLAEFLRRGVGLETMDNAAAARTFNVLVGEGRQAVAVFLLPG